MAKMLDDSNRNLQFPNFTPIYNDTEAAVPLHPSRLSDGNRNNFELKIAPYKELNKFTRRFLFSLLLVQTVLLMIVVIHLMMRVGDLEREASRLTALADERHSKLSEVSQQIFRVRNECHDLFRTDCKMFADINSEEQDLVLNVEVDAQIMIDNDEGGEEKNQTNQNANGKRPTLKKRFQCQKCITGDQPRLVSNNRPKKLLPIPSLVEVGAALNRRHRDALPAEIDMSAVHLKGGLPEIMIKDKGNIEPWFLDRQVHPKSDLSQDYRIPSNRSCVQILTDGFYFIYAQVYYLSEGGSTSFSIIKSGLGNREETMTTCSNGQTTASRDHKEEVSCFTATVARLRAGESLSLHEREMNRRILFRDGRTYFGVMRLMLPSVEHSLPPSTEAPSKVLQI